ncbi:MAG: hypothetical protein JO030_06720 [Candidatus Eremiobacteraeota bacterium]|nr:hypothetical protein [Candidatus Eremiobacteraeota bacterium]
MVDQFVPLWDVLRPTPPVVPNAEDATPPEEAIVAQIQDDDTLSRVRRFRAGLADALDAAVHSLLREIAHDVLGRELLLAPPDVVAIVRAALDRHAGASVITIHAHGDDMPILRDAGMECAQDAALHRGDVVLRLRSGTIDLRMSARMDALLSA